VGLRGLRPVPGRTSLRFVGLRGLRPVPGLRPLRHRPFRHRNGAHPRGASGTRKPALRAGFISFISLQGLRPRPTGASPEWGPTPTVPPARDARRSGTCDTPTGAGDTPTGASQRAPVHIPARKFLRPVGRAKPASQRPQRACEKGPLSATGHRAAERRFAPTATSIELSSPSPKVP
jgi:hypothetical protein